MDMNALMQFLQQYQQQGGAQGGAQQGGPPTLWGNPVSRMQNAGQIAGPGRLRGVVPGQGQTTTDQGGQQWTQQANGQIYPGGPMQQYDTRIGSADYNASHPQQVAQQVAQQAQQAPSPGWSMPAQPNAIASMQASQQAANAPKAPLTPMQQQAATNIKNAQNMRAYNAQHAQPQQAQPQQAQPQQAQQPYGKSDLNKFLVGQKQGM